uniref:Glucan endo-1,3-beta-D-glucosidase n=1 Tax=Oryza punctata TaxID=4537 RepID=A0A0E0JTH0_ORYPU
MGIPDPRPVARACWLAINPHPLVLVLGVLAVTPKVVQSIGVCYGVRGDNLPSPSDVVKLYKSKGIDSMRIYFPRNDILQALSGSNIPLTMGVANENLSAFASDPSVVATWVKQNVQAYPGVNFRYIAVGNEVESGNTQNILPAMQNMNSALSAVGLGNIKVSTSVSTQGVIDGFPPSAGTFSASYMGPIAQYLASTGAPLLANVYPYFSYVDNQAQIDINYALFTSPRTMVQDGGKAYQNLFDAIVDTFYSALESAGAGSVPIVVSESGWPSDGGTAATMDNARAYNQGLIDHVGQGTPKRPGRIETYIFAIRGLPPRSTSASSTRTMRSIGVCNGILGNNLPSPADVVKLYQSNGIAAMRIYSPHAPTLRALAGTDIAVIVDEPAIDQLLTPSAASDWVQSNIKPYYQGVNIKYIAVGNEVSGDATQSILPAMENLNKALSAAGFGKIKVSTAVKMDVLGTSSPPSGGEFSDPAVMGPIAKFLASNGSPLLANVYPYFAYKGGDVDLNFALFQPTTATVTDNGRTYTNLFVAMVDAMYSALEKAGAPGVAVVVSESGWPSAGGSGASADNAQRYNQGLIDHVGHGTPKKPGAMEAYIFAMFNENQKDGDETERHYGLFNPDKSPAYTIKF